VIKLQVKEVRFWTKRRPGGITFGGPAERGVNESASLSTKKGRKLQAKKKGPKIEAQVSQFEKTHSGKPGGNHIIFYSRN